MRRIAHIVNPVKPNPTSDLVVAQPITFETMRTAKDYARGIVDVEWFTAQYPEDRPIVPDGFHVTPDLERSVMDVGTFRRPRKLPLLKDILDRLYAASDAEYFIYTNVDIAVMPYFYVAIDSLIASGYDALVVNRRSIPTTYSTLDQIPSMYAELGMDHPGHDCFVFRRDAYLKYRLGTICIGAPWIGRVFIWNVACHARRFHEFTDKHLTFHIGFEGPWIRDEFSDYTAHNAREAAQVQDELQRLDSAASVLSQYPPLGQNPPARGIRSWLSRLKRRMTS